MPKPKVSTTFNAVDKMKGPMKKMKKAIGIFAKGAGVALGLAAVGIGKLISEASKIEDAVAGFTPLLGGFEKANLLVEKLNQTAATTPFQFEAISKAAKQLLPVMDGDLEKIIATFRRLGDTAGGDAQKLESITRGFTKAMLKGKVDMESLNMIAEAGVPIYTELASSLGVSVAEMMKLSSAGKIASSDLEDAFKNMTSEGGIFFKGMEIASKTLTGKLSTLKDNIALTAASIGMQLMPTIKPLVDQAIKAAGAMREWVNNNKDLINQKLQSTFKGIGATVSFVVKLWNSGLLPALIAGITTFKLITGAIALYKTATAAAMAMQIAFNAAMAANPASIIIMAIIAAVSLLVAGIILIVKNWKKVKETILAVWEKIKVPFEKIGEFLGKGTGLDVTAGQQQAQAALTGRNDALIQGGGVTNRSLVGINIAGLPQGSTVDQRGKAPGVTLNYGYRAGGI